MWMWFIQINVESAQETVVARCSTQPLGKLSVLHRGVFDHAAVSIQTSSPGHMCIWSGLKRLQEWHHQDNKPQLINGNILFEQVYFWPLFRFHFIIVAERDCEFERETQQFDKKYLIKCEWSGQRDWCMIHQVLFKKGGDKNYWTQRI